MCIFVTSWRLRGPSLCRCPDRDLDLCHASPQPYQSECYIALLASLAISGPCTDDFLCIFSCICVDCNAMHIWTHVQCAHLDFAFTLVLQAVLRVWQVSCMILAFSTVYYQFLSHLQLYQHHPNDTATTTCPSLDDDGNASPPNNYDSGDHTQDKCWTTPTISNIKWQSCWWQPSLFSMPASGLTKLAARIFFWCGTIWVVATSFHFHSCFNALCLFFFFAWPSWWAIQEERVHYMIQAVHLIPTFQYGCTTELLPPSVTRCKSDNSDEDGIGTMWACTFFNTLD